MPRSRKDHRHPVFVSSLDDLGVAKRLAGLDDGGDAGLGGHVHAVAEGKEGIRTEHSSLSRHIGFHPGDFYRVHPAHLSRPDADELIFAGVDDGV